jgi:cytochrome c2
MRKGISGILCAGLILTACHSEGGNEGKEGAQDKPLSPSAKGAMIFNQNCSSCHSLNKDIVGPALHDVLTRWHGNTAGLKAFIRNPQQQISAGDSMAVKTYNKWQPSVMNGFPSLTNEDLDNLIAYLQDNNPGSGAL